MLTGNRSAPESPDWEYRCLRLLGWFGGSAYSAIRSLAATARRSTIRKTDRPIDRAKRRLSEIVPRRSDRLQLYC